MNTRVLTGITTSGTPISALRRRDPPGRRHQYTQPGVDAFFLADYHALIVRRSGARGAIAAGNRRHLAGGGPGPERVTFYRQSDIPEIPELCWVLNCVTAKGLMNRAHAYKASVDQNEAKGVEPDDGVTMGLFSYPVLMAATS